MKKQHEERLSVEQLDSLLNALEDDFANDIEEIAMASLEDIASELNHAGVDLHDLLDRVGALKAKHVQITFERERLARAQVSEVIADAFFPEPVKRNPTTLLSPIERILIPHASFRPTRPARQQSKQGDFNSTSHNLVLANAMHVVDLRFNRFVLRRAGYVFWAILVDPFQRNATAIISRYSGLSSAIPYRIRKLWIV